MKIRIKTAHGYLSAQPPTPGGLVRWQYRDEAGPWEEFDLEGFELPKPDPKPPPPDQFDPNVRQPWPRPMPPDIDTTDINEVTNRVDWNLQANNCSDPRSLWVGYVMDVAGEGHKKGWTGDGYWRTEKMSKAEGNGKGYVWPPK